jgi:hypothetical protein
MHRHRRGLVRALRKLKLTDLVTFATLVKMVIEIVRSLASHS